MNFKINNKEFCVEKKVVIISGILLIMATIIGFYFLNSQTASSKDIVLSNLVKTPLSTSGADSSQKSSPNNTNQPQNKQSSDEISVYVRGCVKNPSIVKIYKGQMIVDAIEKAGGITDEADIDNINLVYILNENVMLKINPKGYVKKSTIEEQQSNTTGTKKVNYAGNGVEISKETEGVLLAEEKSAGASETEIAEVNINSATVDELDTLPGIGPKKAADIFAFREKNGNFKAIENIMDVSGIGESTFANVKEYIYVWNFSYAIQYCALRSS